MQKFVSFYILLISFTFADTDVYSGGSIQDAITNATPGETIIVHDGTYIENLLIEKDLILRSENGASVTTIDGSDATNGSDMGSSIIVRPESNTTHHPLVVIEGFTVTGGKGSTCKKVADDGTVYNINVGGGLYAYVSTPKIKNTKFRKNGNSNTDKGGAVFAASDTEDCDWSTRDDYIDSDFLEPVTDTLFLSTNKFFENQADEGHSVYVVGDDFAYLSMADDSLDVFSTTYNSTTEYWVISEYDIDYMNTVGEYEAILTDVWVNPDTLIGVDEGNIIGDSLNPFLTINYAMGMIYSTGGNPINIYLTEGEFSPSNNNELFPINMHSNLNLIGFGEELTILNAQSNEANPGRVINLELCDNNKEIAGHSLYQILSKLLNILNDLDSRNSSDIEQYLFDIDYLNIKDDLDMIKREQKNLSLQIILQSEVIEWYIKILNNRIRLRVVLFFIEIILSNIQIYNSSNCYNYKTYQCKPFSGFFFHKLTKNFSKFKR